MPYCYSTDSENFTGRFSNFSEAIAESLAKTKHGDSFWIAESRQPIQPEDLWDAEDWLEHVSVQDDYGGDFGEGWDLSSKQQREELEAEVRSVMKSWLDRHELRPTHYCVDESVKYLNLGGVAILGVQPPEPFE